MTLPLGPAAAGSRGRWPFADRRAARAALLALLVLGAISLPGRAEDAEADQFSATVTVDATADTVAKAREKARSDGQRRALAQIAERLAGGSAPAKPPKLDDKAITDLVASFEVANERMSAVRYAADYTFHFRPAEVRRVLGNAGAATGAAAGAATGAAAASEPGKTLIVIPIYQSGGQSRLWDDPNPWREAWEQRASGNASGNAAGSAPSGSAPGTGTARLLVPLGDAGDIAAIDADKARAGDAAALAAIARQNGGDQALVALAATSGPANRPTGVEVTARRYRAGRLVDSHVEPVLANPGESERDLLRRAALSIAAQIESGWKKEAVPGYDQQGSLTAVLPITGLDDWVGARERLGAVPVIRKIVLVALSRQEATIEIGYVGSVDQLKASLAGISLDLVRGDPRGDPRGDRVWRLARTGPGRAP